MSYDYSYFDSNYDKENNIDDKEQVYRLIMSYARSNSAIVDSLRNYEDGIVDFVSYAYVHFMEVFYDKYNPNISKLSTYVYTTMSYLYPIFVNQVKYSLDFNSARKLINSFKPEVRDIMRKMYAERKTVDFCDTSIEIGTDDLSGGDDDDIKYMDLSLADPNDCIENLLNEYNDEDLYKQFDLILDRYIKLKNIRNGDRAKEIIKEYTFRNMNVNDNRITLESIGNKHGLTRERIRQILSKFYIWARNDKELKACLDSDYIDRINHEREKKYGERDF